MKVTWPVVSTWLTPSRSGQSFTQVKSLLACRPGESIPTIAAFQLTVFQFTYVYHSISPISLPTPPSACYLLRLVIPLVPSGELKYAYLPSDRVSGQLARLDIRNCVISRVFEPFPLLSESSFRYSLYTPY